MKKLSGNQIRQMYLDFFASKGHKVEASHSLIPENDPTLLWINAGVAALKKYFDGSIKSDVTRITNAQKSIRTNDIENVGKTARHHTFFEMLGNFSIGDYFKNEAIEFAWELLTSPEWFDLDKEKLYITVHDKDQEAYIKWLQMEVSPTHILKTPNNFWEIGAGPCGPDSEIFYDRGEEYDPEKLGERLFFEELENDRYVEIWNLVFSQYNSQPGIPREEYKELPQKNIDTGMGLERITSVIQGGETNFDTDLFLPIIHKTETMATVKYADNKMAYRVIADHIRTVVFALADGAMFDNTGRGYVLRRLLRRTVRFAKQIGIEDPFMENLVSVVITIMDDYYPYLVEKVDYIKKAIRKEELLFHKTLANGEKLLASIIENNTTGVINGKDTFKLYDTYGFPVELTMEIAQESNLTVDQEAFQEELRIQQERSRDARNANNSMNIQKEDLMTFEEESVFLYDVGPVEATVIGCFQDGVKVDQIINKGELIFNQTNFYGEMGGQCGDSGTIDGDGKSANVVDVKVAPNHQHLHYIEVIEGPIAVGDKFILHIDLKRRAKIAANHSATHLLQAALKEVIGKHVKQAGSYVDEARLRFDFTHFEKIGNDQLNEIEGKVNQKIFEAIETNVEIMNKEEALAKGAMALFDDKYSDQVRVVSFDDFSIELCGGTHVTNSANIGLFKIVSEESIGSGIRRIEAITSKAAYKYMVNESGTVDAIKDILGLKNRKEVVNRVRSLVDELNANKKELAKAHEQINASKAANIMDNVIEVNGIPLLYIEENLNNKDAKNLALDLKNRFDEGIVVMVSYFEDKASYYVGVGGKLVASGIKAGEVIKKINGIVNGRGGGKPDFAQGGCPINQEIKNLKARLIDILI